MLRLAVLVGALVAPCLSAGPATIDFEPLRHDDALITDVNLSYAEDGFRLSATHLEPGNPWRFGVAGTQHYLFPGSTAAFHGVSNGVTTLTQDGGGPFDLLSIRLAELPAGDGMGGTVPAGPFGLTFTGLRADGSIVTSAFTVGAFPAFEVFTFAGFTGLASVTWTQGAGPPMNPTHQFDDIVVQAVPEPSALLLAAAGVVIVSARRRVRP